MRGKIFVFLLLFSSIGIKAQQTYFEQEPDSIVSLAPRIAVKVVPSQLIWRFPAYAIGLEHRFNNNWGVDYGIGLIQNQNNFDDDESYFDNKSGFKTSIMFKNYSSENGALGSSFNFFNGDSYNQSPVRSFLGFEVFYNQVKFERTRTFRFDCENGCEYFERVTYGLKMKGLGVRANIGFIITLVNPISLEVAWAVGLANRVISEDDRKPTDYNWFFGRRYNEDFEGIVPSFNMNIKLVYEIK